MRNKWIKWHFTQDLYAVFISKFVYLLNPIRINICLVDRDYLGNTKMLQSGLNTFEVMYPGQAGFCDEQTQVRAGAS